MGRIFAILFFVFSAIPFVQSQVEIYQIEPDTLTRRIIMTDTLTEIDTQFIEFRYHSIDSLVSEIVIDSLGIDTTAQWYLSDTNSISPKRTRGSNNIFLGQGTADSWDLSVLTANQDYNFYAGNQLRQNVAAVESNNVIFGSNNASNVTNSFQNNFIAGTGNALAGNTTFINNVIFGSNNLTLAEDLQNNTIIGTNNLNTSSALMRNNSVFGTNNYELANSLFDANIINGTRNGSSYTGTGDIEYNIINGYFVADNAPVTNSILNGQNVATYNAIRVKASVVSGPFAGAYASAIDQSVLVGEGIQSTSSNVGAVVQSLNVGAGNYSSNTGTLNRSVAVGYRNSFLSLSNAQSSHFGYENLRNASSDTRNFTSGFRNIYSATGSINYSTAIGSQNFYNASSVDYSTAIGSENFYNASSVDYSTAFGYRNNYAGISDVYYSFLAGYQNANNATSIYYSTAMGFRNFEGTGALTSSFIAGRSNIGENVPQLARAFVVGNYNLLNATATELTDVLIVGSSNARYSNGSIYRRTTLIGELNADYSSTIQESYINGYQNARYNEIYRSFVNGTQNLASANLDGAQLINSFINGYLNMGNSTGLATSDVSASLINGDVNLRYSSGFINQSLINGAENAVNVGNLTDVFISGYANIYQSTSALSNTIAIGTENGYNLADQSNSIYLGYRQGYTTGAANKLMIGMGQDDPLLSGDFSSDWIRVDGYLEVRDKTGTAGNLAAWDGDKIIEDSYASTDLIQTLTGNQDSIFLSDPSGINDTVLVSGFLTSEVDGSTTNELQDLTWDNITNTMQISNGTNAVITGFLESEVDGSVSNEIQTLTGNVDTLFLSDPVGNPDTVVVGLSEVDGSVTNELQDLTWDNSTNTMQISNGTNAVITGFLESEVDGSVTNEGLMTLTTTIADQTYTYSSNTSGSDPLILTEGTDISLTRVGNAINIASTASSSPQTLSKSGGEVTLSDGGGSVEVHTLVTGSDIAIVDASNAIADIVVGEIDLTLHSGTATQLLGRDGNISAGEIVQTNIGSGLDLTTGTLLVDETELDETDISARTCMITGIGTGGAETSTTEVILDLGTGFSVEVPSTGAFNIGVDEVDVVNSGYYRVTATMRVGGNDGADIDIRLTRNGTTIITQNMFAGSPTTCTLTAVTYISAGQDIDIRSDWNSGTSYYVDDIYLTIELIGG